MKEYIPTRFVALLLCSIFFLFVISTALPAHAGIGPAAGGQLGSLISWVLPNTETMINWVARPFANFLIWISGGFLWLGGQLLDYSVRTNVCDLAQYTHTDVVTNGWTIARNVANFFFIFILLYIAISIILQLGGDQKKLIVWVVIIALIINFSAVFTRFVIDVSNVFAYQFYSSIVGRTVSDPCTAEQSSAQGIAARYMRALTLNEWAQEDQPSTKTIYKTDSSGLAAIMVAGIGSAVFIMITAWSFIVAAVLMFMRTALLMILIILSPLAFVGAIVPQLRNMMGSWWAALTGQAFFAPMYLFFVFLTLVLIQGSAGVFEAASSKSGTSILMSAFVKYSIYITLIIFGLVQAKKMSSIGAEAVQKKVLGGLDWARGQTTGVAGRHTIGRMGRALGDSEWVKSASAGGKGMWGKVAGVPLKALGDKTAEAKYGGTKSYSDVVKRQTERAKGIRDPFARAQAMGTMSAAAQKAYYDSLSEREKAETSEAAKSYGGQTAERVRAQQERLTPEQLEKVEKAGVEGKDAVHKKEQSADIEAIVGNPDKKLAGLPKSSPERKERIEKVVKGLKDDEGRKLQKIIEDADEADIDTLYAHMDPLDLVDLAGKAKLTEDSRIKMRKGLARHKSANPNSAIVLEVNSNPKLYTLFGIKKKGGEETATS